VPQSALWRLVAIPTLAATAAAQAPASAIHRVNGLVLTGVVHEERGDVEVLAGISGVTPAKYDVSISSDIPNAADSTKPTRLDVGRTIRMADDSASHRVNQVLASDDPPVFPGSSLFLSTVMLTELKSAGKTSIVYADEAPGAFKGALAILGSARQYFRGDLTRVGSVTVPVIVQGERVQLPGIEARGHLTVGSDVDDLDIVVLDNPQWPLTLRWSAHGRAGQTTEIEWPVEGTRDSGQAHGRVSAISGGLAKECRAELHGIYFAFASAKLEPESDRALKDVAAILAANPTWVVTIEGHTDSIGSHASNIDLSKRRAAAVRDALASRFGVASARLSATGFGDSRPIETNKTIEGRARNRRVELSRKC